MGEELELVVTVAKPRFRGKRTQYRWKINSTRNHETLAVSSEGYNNLDDALHSAALVLGWAPTRRVGTQRISRGEM